jgi:glycogen debranching enzyme
MFDTRDHRPVTAREHRRKEEILTQAEPSKLAGSHAGAALKFDDAFVLTDNSGDIPWALPHAYGLYSRDTRFVNGLALRLQGLSLVPLSNTHLGSQDAAFDLANPDFSDERGLDVPQHTVSVRRERRLHGGVLHERIQLTNYFKQPARVRLEIRFRCGFEDVFVVKKFVESSDGRQPRASVLNGRHALWRHRGIDDILRQTHLVFDAEPVHLGPTRAVFILDVAPDEPASIALAITPIVGAGDRCASQPRRLESLDSRIQHADRLWLQSSTAVQSSSDLFDRVFDRSLRDLRLLRSRLGRQHYFAAGIPWFVTLFGRDASLVGIQTLPYGGTTAPETIELLARHQAQHVDEYRDAEPGKILHEFRRGELARAGEIPQSLSYYGSVDATALFVILFAEYVLWSGNLSFARAHRREFEAALRWIESRIESAGYLTYDGQYENGLVNQGWKDSGNAIVNADGSLATPPIALAEVQGYAFRAWKQAAGVMRALDAHTQAEHLDEQAEALASRFERDFWSDSLGCYVLAVQRNGRQAAVVASNAGQVLWSGIARDDRARRVIERLVQDDMFSGWGIRTLARGEVRYNPVSYHLGSVWPHDNALILGGFRRYGDDACALRIFDALLDAAIEFRGRLPELFCGFRRREHESPVPYPAASSPQAWASGALAHGLWNLLGLRPDALESRLHIIRPVLPGRLQWLTLRSFRVGNSTVDVHFRRRDEQITVDAEVRAGALHVQVHHDAHRDE